MDLQIDKTTEHFGSVVKRIQLQWQLALKVHSLHDLISHGSKQALAGTGLDQGICASEVLGKQECLQIADIGEGPLSSPRQGFISRDKLPSTLTVRC